MGLSEVEETLVKLIVTNVYPQLNGTLIAIACIALLFSRLLLRVNAGLVFVHEPKP